MNNVIFNSILIYGFNVVSNVLDMAKSTYDYKVLYDTYKSFGMNRHAECLKGLCL